MIKTTTIVETHQTPAGSVEAEIRVTVAGDPDAIARVDRALLKHIQELRPNDIANPSERKVISGCVELYAPTVGYFEQLDRMLAQSQRAQLHAGGGR